MDKACVKHRKECNKSIRGGTFVLVKCNLAGDDRATEIIISVKQKKFLKSS